MATVAACSITLEQKYGIPTAPFTTYKFEPVVREDRKAGYLPFLFTPHPVIGMSDETLYGYIVGNNPDTGKPVIEDIIANLTQPVDEKKLKFQPEEMATADSTSRLLKPDTEDNLQRLFYERGWTDGLPIILPTEERVQRMLAGTGAAPDEVVGEIGRFDIRGNVKYTVTNVAVIAVMAGAQPEHFPVILATAATNAEAMRSSTADWSSMLLVNGPIRNEIDMNAGIGAFSPVNYANSVLGRAWTLMSNCWVDMRPKKNMWSSQGHNLSYNNNCCAENEEASVWEPFHVQKGFNKDESIVSVFWGYTLNTTVGTASKRSIGEELCLQMRGIPAVYAQATIIVDPLVARTLKEKDGFDTKEAFSQWLSANIKQKAGEFWGYDYVDWIIAPQAEQGIEPYATFKKAAPDELIAPYHDPGKINIIVVGGETNPLWKYSDYGYVTSVSVDKWRPHPSGVVCKDGTCGLPDEVTDADYD